MSGTSSVTLDPLLSEEEMSEAFVLFKELYPSLTEAQYTSRVREMRAQNHYRIFGLKSQGALIGLIGFIQVTNLLYGKYLWVHDLIVRKEFRSRGLGRKLMAFVEELATEEHCQFVALSAHVSHIQAQEFYHDKMSYEKRGFVYRSRLLRQEMIKSDRW
jgi:GNAT superfamily N-acetyltransferase